MVYRHDRGQRQILSRAVGSTMVNLNTAILSSLLLPLPEVNEQQRIQNVAYSWTTRMQGEQARLAKLGALKLGLMDDLLTGRVRVSTPERVSA
jgi:type I restriction enzyme S subunit